MDGPIWLTRRQGSGKRQPVPLTKYPIPYERGSRVLRCIYGGDLDGLKNYIPYRYNVNQEFMTDGSGFNSDYLATLAITHDQADIFRWLLKRGLDPFQRKYTGGGLNLFSAAARRTQVPTDIVNLLFHPRNDGDFLNDQAEKAGNNTAAHFAVMSENVYLLQKLLEMGNLVKVATSYNSNKETALSLAIKLGGGYNGNPTMARMLAIYAKKVSKEPFTYVDNSGYTPLELAIRFKLHDVAAIISEPRSPPPRPPPPPPPPQFCPQPAAASQQKHLCAVCSKIVEEVSRQVKVAEDGGISTSTTVTFGPKRRQHRPEQRGSSPPERPEIQADHLASFFSGMEIEEKMIVDDEEEKVVAYEGMREDGVVVRERRGGERRIAGGDYEGRVVCAEVGVNTVVDETTAADAANEQAAAMATAAAADAERANEQAMVAAAAVADAERRRVHEQAMVAAAIERARANEQAMADAERARAHERAHEQAMAAAAIERARANEQAAADAERARTNEQEMAAATLEAADAEIRANEQTMAAAAMVVANESRRVVEEEEGEVVEEDGVDDEGGVIDTRPAQREAESPSPTSADTGDDADVADAASNRSPPSNLHRPLSDIAEEEGESSLGDEEWPVEEMWDSALALDVNIPYDIPDICAGALTQTNDRNKAIWAELKDKERTILDLEKQLKERQRQLDKCSQRSETTAVRLKGTEAKLKEYEMECRRELDTCKKQLQACTQQLNVCNSDLRATRNGRYDDRVLELHRQLTSVEGALAASRRSYEQEAEGQAKKVKALNEALNEQNSIIRKLRTEATAAAAAAIESTTTPTTTTHDTSSASSSDSPSSSSTLSLREKLLDNGRVMTDAKVGELTALIKTNSDTWAREKERLIKDHTAQIAALQKENADLDAQNAADYLEYTTMMEEKNKKVANQMLQARQDLDDQRETLKAECEELTKTTNLENSHLRALTQDYDARLRSKTKENEAMEAELVRQKELAAQYDERATLYQRKYEGLRAESEGRLDDCNKDMVTLREMLDDMKKGRDNNWAQLVAANKDKEAALEKVTEIRVKLAAAEGDVRLTDAIENTDTALATLANIEAQLIAAKEGEKAALVQVAESRVTVVDTTAQIKKMNANLETMAGVVAAAKNDQEASIVAVAAAKKEKEAALVAVADIEEQLAAVKKEKDAALVAVAEKKDETIHELDKRLKAIQLQLVEKDRKIQSLTNDHETALDVLHGKLKSEEARVKMKQQSLDKLLGHERSIEAIQNARQGITTTTTQTEKKKEEKETVEDARL